jgi:hypothetical protein
VADDTDPRSGPVLSVERQVLGRPVVTALWYSCSCSTQPQVTVVHTSGARSRAPCGAQGDEDLKFTDLDILRLRRLRREGKLPDRPDLVKILDQILPR